MYCSECGTQLEEEPINLDAAQPDHFYPWCQICLDYVDGMEDWLNGTEDQRWNEGSD